MDDPRTAAEIEAENMAKVKALVDLGVPLSALQTVALQVRVAALVDMLPPDTLDRFERLYEHSIAAVLDEIHENITTREQS